MRRVRGGVGLEAHGYARPGGGGLWGRRPVQRAIGLSLTYAVLTVGGCIVLLPALWMLSTALKTSSQIFTVPIEWLPRPVVPGNFLTALRMIPFGTYFLNSTIVTVLATTGTVVSSSIVAYGFARLRWRGRNAVFYCVLATLMLPAHIMLIPKFILFRYLHWINTLLPLIVPLWFGTPFAIFLLRQFYTTIPLELDEAARIDGCSRLGVWWRVSVPLLQPALVTVALLSFHAHWNDLIDPLIYLHSNRLYTLSLGLLSFKGEYNTYWNYLMAASLVAMLPVLLVFYVIQKYFLKGIQLFAGLSG